jgi:alkylation response protein AidB-like acyl-CoA dehydrogenase
VQSLPQPYRDVEEIERVLGNPSLPDNPFSFREAVRLDDQDCYPEVARQRIEKWGFSSCYVPVAYGGRLRSFDEMLARVRVVARRDLTLAIGHIITFLGCLPVWAVGTDQQRQRVAEMVKGDASVAFAITERAHGGDLVGCEVAATRVSDGYVLSGEKWLINVATRSQAMVVLARTNSDGGARGFSLFLVDKDRIDPSRYEHLPRVKTHGIRGTDISGIRFLDCLLPETALLGRPGDGLETVLKMLQVSRVMCAGFSIGAADTALRTTVEFADKRQLYGGPVLDIPHVRGVLADAFLDAILAEAVLIAATRAAHVMPEQISVWSAIGKYLAPTRVEAQIRSLSVILGASFYLREGLQDGIFQKLMRDNDIVSVFEGSTIVNLNIIVSQLGLIAKRHRSRDVDRQRAQTRLAQVFRLSEELPPYALDRIQLMNPGPDPVTDGLDLAIAELRSAATVRIGDTVGLASVTALAERLSRLVDSHHESVTLAVATAGTTFERGPEMIRLARRHALLHSACVILYFWIYNRHELGPFFARGEWLNLLLSRLLCELGETDCGAADHAAHGVVEELVRLYRENRAFSMLPIKLGEGVGDG